MQARRFIALPVVTLMAVSAFSVSVWASGWQEAPHSRARLLAAGQVSTARLAGRAHWPAPALMAGLEIRLDPGWKTYWRTPGDGIAPQFDWSGSQNAAATRVLWPVPQHFRDAAGAYNGYRDRVVLPVLVAPKRPGAPISLDLSLEYAVCKDICIPVRKRLSLQLSGERTSGRDAVLRALQQTPVRADAQGRCSVLTLRDLRARLGGPSPHLEATIAHPPESPPVDLFAEVSTGQFMAHPQHRETGRGRSVFRVDMRAWAHPRQLAGETVTLTAVATSQSCEMVRTVK